MNVVYKIWIAKLDVKDSIVYLVALLSNSSVIRQKDKSQNKCYKKTNHAKFSEKQTFLTPWYAWDSPFCLISDKFWL